MPTPDGQITSSEVWVTEASEPEENKDEPTTEEKK